MQEVASNEMSNHGEKRKTMSQANHIYQGHFQMKLPLLLILHMAQ